MPIKLNPCAKCGGTPERRFNWEHKAPHYVCCTVCFEISTPKSGRDKADAAWNAANPKEGNPNG